MDHDENLERCKLILTGMDDDAIRIAGRPFFKVKWGFADSRRRRPKNRMYHDEIPERCKLNFTGIVDDALRIAGELFPKQTLKNTLERKLKSTPTDGDEAHFWLNGYVNKQNCRIWSEANPQVYVETPLHPEKLTVWYALWAGRIIGPYFFKNDEGHNVTVNGDRYRAMITNFFIPELNNHDVQELWFQKDGATCHTARATIDLLKDTFGDRLISRFGPVNWPV
ncbi:DDE_3 domain-containing protein [Trichonephila clavipes]|nr:DDE_3 domain-containing protein [Trichonephila clavipes]